MAYTFTRQQLLNEADRYLAKAASLPDSDPAKPQWIAAANNLSNTVLARVYHKLAVQNGIPDDLEN